MTDVGISSIAGYLPRLRLSKKTVAQANSWIAPNLMGKGKGTPEFWVAKVKPGRIMFEIDGVTKNSAEEALNLASAKLPMETKVVGRLGES